MLKPNTHTWASSTIITIVSEHQNIKQIECHKISYICIVLFTSHDIGMIFTDNLQISYNYKWKWFWQISQNRFKKLIIQKSDHLLAGSIRTQLELFDWTQLDGTHCGSCSIFSTTSRRWSKLRLRSSLIIVLSKYGA